MIPALAVWALASVPVSLLVAKFIHAGQGDDVAWEWPEDEDDYYG